jgi:hypothetical protein
MSEIRHLRNQLNERAEKNVPDLGDIQQELSNMTRSPEQQRRRRSLWPLIAAAAAVAVILSIGSFLALRTDYSDQSPAALPSVTTEVPPAPSSASTAVPSSATAPPSAGADPCSVAWDRYPSAVDELRLRVDGTPNQREERLTLKNTSDKVARFEDSLAGFFIVEGRARWSTLIYDVPVRQVTLAPGKSINLLQSFHAGEAIDSTSQCAPALPTPGNYQYSGLIKSNDGTVYRIETLDVRINADRSITFLS